MAVNGKLVNTSRLFGKYIGRYPYWFLVIPVLITVVLSPGLTKLNRMTSTLYLYTPSNGRFIQDRDAVEKIFPMNLSTTFDPGRVTREISCGYVIMVAKDGGSMLREKIFQDVLKVDRIVKNVSVTYDGRVMSYSHLCARRKKNCYVNDILSLSRKMSDVESGKIQFKYPLDMKPNGYLFTYYAVNLGGVETDPSGFVLSAKSVRLLYYLSDVEPKEANKLWEAAFLDRFKEEVFEHITVYRYTSQTVDTELQALSRHGRIWVGLALIVVSTCCFVFCLLSNRPWLWIGTVFSAGLAVVSSFGLLGYCGVGFISSNFMLAFLALALSADDTYQLLNCRKLTDFQKTKEKKIVEIYASALPSIFTSTVINVLFFAISHLFISLPAIRIFCIYTGTSVLFSFIYDILFVGALMTIYDETEQNRHYLTCCQISNDKERLKPSTDNAKKDEKFFHNLVALDNKFFLIFTSHPFKLFIIFAFIAYIAIAGWRIATGIKIGTELSNVVSYNSYGGQFVKHNNLYYSRYPYRVQVVINATLDYSDPSVRKKIQDLTLRMEKCRYIGERNLTESWLKYYMIFLNDSRSSSFTQGLDVRNKDDFVTGLRDIFLRLPITEIFRGDVKFSEDGKNIVASRFVLQAADVTLSDGEKEMVKELREIADTSPYPIVVYSYGFPHSDRLLALVTICCSILCVALISYFVITVLFFGKMVCSFISVVCLVFVIVGTVAYLSLWNVNLNSATLLNLLLVISLVIRYATYVNRACIASGNDEQTRSLYKTAGMPILLSTVPLIVGTTITGFGPSYIYICFFKVTFLLVTASLFQYLFVVPVLLFSVTYFKQSWTLPNMINTDLNLEKFKQNKS